MKKAFLLLSIFFAYSLFAQQNQPEPGTYESNQKTGQNIKLVIDEKNKYHITFLSGEIEQENDSLYFHTPYENESLFQVEYTKEATKTNTIKVSFANSSYYSFYGLYLGVQKINDTEVDYKTFKELSNYDEDISYDKYDKNEQLTFEIEKAAFIYLVKERYGRESVIEKYEVPNGVTEIKIAQKSDLYGKLNLKGKYDATTKEITISEGKNPITFTKVQETVKDENQFIKPIESLQKKNWTYPGKEIEDFTAAADSVVVDEDDYYSNDKPQYVFRLKTEKSLNDALKVAQSSQDKILVVFYDTDKNASKDFETYIQKYESQIQDYMYDQYEPKLDKFNFYLATESDANAMKKMGVTENKSIVFINSDGTKIHHAKGRMRGYGFNHYKLSSYFTELDLLNGKVKLDKVIADKKTTPEKIQKAFLSVVGVQENSYYDDYDESFQPPVVTRVGDVRDVYEAVDSTVVVVEEEFDLPEKQNAYQFKSSQDAVALKYKQVLDFYQKEKTVNEELVGIIIAELSGYGFTKKLFETNNQATKPIDFQSMEYLFQFYKEIETIKTDSNYPQTSQNLIRAVCRMLSRPSNENQKEKVKEYCDKLLKATNYNSTVYRQIVNLYDDSKNKSELVNVFDLYFNSIVKPNTNLIEVLDANYQSEKARDWDSYKADFASLANNTAWYIVENSQDKTEIQKAIQWSETSLKLKANDPYYLDTLAQLYYKNGEKEKGILYEQKAIEAAKIVDDTLIDTYEAVLEKMKNGTY